MTMIKTCWKKANEDDKKDDYSSIQINSLTKDEFEKIFQKILREWESDLILCGGFAGFITETAMRFVFLLLRTEKICTKLFLKPVCLLKLFPALMKIAFKKQKEYRV